jgi:phage terminase large subunit
MVDASLLQRFGRWRRDPLTFVREVFQTEPDTWQADVLQAFPTHQRLAMKACKGPGKSCVMAWLAWNFLLTRPHPKIAAASISGDNLADGLWTEMAKWQHKSPLLQQTFTWQKTRIFANDHPETWWMSARQWAKSANKQQQADSLAGFHADYTMFLLDEAGGIPDSVVATAEAALATGKETKLVISGNPTHVDGPLYRACNQEAHLWHVTEITSDPDDPKRTPRVSIEWAKQQIEKYGRDNPWVLVNVFGRFPPSSLNALLGPDDVRDAMKRRIDTDAAEFAARVLGVDVAREGDDCSVIFPRQGRQAFEPIVMRNVKSIEGAGRVARKWNDWQATTAFIDNTGGWGGGWVDQLRQIGLSPTPVEFAGSPMDPRYLNKRAEIWFLMAEWVREGGALPDVPELIGELTTPTYTFKGDKFMLEPKDKIKERLGRSPDLADALALTFAFPVAMPKLEDMVRMSGLDSAEKKWDEYGFGGA